MDSKQRNDYLDELDSLDLPQLLERESQTPRDVDLLVRIGGAYLRRGFPDKTERYYQHALALEPKNGWTHAYIGNLYYTLNQLDDAIAAFRRSIELMPDVSCAYWCLADVYHAKGNFVLADSNYKQAVQVDPNDEQAKRNLQRWQSRPNELQDSADP